MLRCPGCLHRRWRARGIAHRQGGASSSPSLTCPACRGKSRTEHFRCRSAACDWARRGRSSSRCRRVECRRRAARAPGQRRRRFMEPRCPRVAAASRSSASMQLGSAVVRRELGPHRQDRACSERDWCRRASSHGGGRCGPGRSVRSVPCNVQHDLHGTAGTL